MSLHTHICLCKYVCAHIQKKSKMKYIEILTEFCYNNMFYFIIYIYYIF